MMEKNFKESFQPFLTDTFTKKLKFYKVATSKSENPLYKKLLALHEEFLALNQLRSVELSKTFWYTRESEATTINYGGNCFCGSEMISHYVPTGGAGTMPHYKREYYCPRCEKLNAIEDRIKCLCREMEIEENKIGWKLLPWWRKTLEKSLWSEKALEWASDLYSNIDSSIYGRQSYWEESYLKIFLVFTAIVGIQMLSVYGIYLLFGLKTAGGCLALFLLTYPLVKRYCSGHSLPNIFTLTLGIATAYSAWLAVISFSKQLFEPSQWLLGVLLGFQFIAICGITVLKNNKGDWFYNGYEEYISAWWLLSIIIPVVSGLQLLLVWGIHFWLGLPLWWVGVALAIQILSASIYTLINKGKIRGDEYDFPVPRQLSHDNIVILWCFAVILVWLLLSILLLIAKLSNYLFEIF